MITQRALHHHADIRLYGTIPFESIYL